jgi:hypothetical protein
VTAAIQSMALDWEFADNLRHASISTTSIYLHGKHDHPYPSQ